MLQLLVFLLIWTVAFRCVVGVVGVAGVVADACHDIEHMHFIQVYVDKADTCNIDIAQRSAR